MGSPVELLSSVLFGAGAGVAAGAMKPTGELEAPAVPKPEAPPPAAAPASSPISGKAKRGQPSFLAGSSLIPGPAPAAGLSAAPQTKSLLGQ